MMQEGGEVEYSDPYEERADDLAIEKAQAAYDPNVNAVPARDFTLGSGQSFVPTSAPDPYEERAGQSIDYVRPAPDPYEERPKDTLADRALRVVSSQPQPAAAPRPAAPAPAKAPAQQPGFSDRLFSGPQYQSTGQKVVDNGQVNWGDSQNAADFFRADKAMQEALKKASAASPAPAPVPAARQQVMGYARPVLEQRSPAMAAIDRQTASEAGRPFFDIPFLAGDLSKGSTYARAAEPLQNVSGIVFHHTAGRGRPEDIVNVLNQRGLGVQFIMDRDGSIYQALPNGSRGAHMRPSQVVPLDNSNAIGVEMIARDNDDVTPEQVAAARNLFDTLRKQYPDLQPWGHGEVNSHKMSTEGMAAVSAIRSAYDIQPKFQNVQRAAPPMGARTLRGYQTGDYAEGGRVPLLSDQYPTSYLPHVGRQVMQDGGEAGGEGTSIIETTPPVEQATEPVVQRAEQVLRPYEPTIKERIRGAIAGFDVGKPSVERERFATGISQLVPGISLQDATRAAQAGQYWKAGEEALSALPVVAAPRAAPAILPGAVEKSNLMAQSILPTGVKYEPLKKLPVQSQDELARMYLTAERIKPEFDAVNRKIAESVGGEWQAPSLKGSARAVEKSIDDYKGDVRNLKDLVRGTIVVNSVDDVPKVIEAIRAKYPIEKSGFRNFLDRNVTPADGYRDAKMNVVVDGQKTELQITTPELARAKETAHGYYEQRRSIEGGVARRGGQETPEEAAEIDFLNQQMKKTYEDAWARSLARTSPTSERNSLSVMEPPLRRAESGGKRRGGSSSQAAQYGTGSPAAMVTGIPSTSKNSVRGENFMGNGVQSKSDQINDSTKPLKREGGFVENALKVSTQFGPGAAQDAVRSLKQRPGRR
jgi:hypothetical protein